jgi:hypothetical protein
MSNDTQVIQPEAIKFFEQLQILSIALGALPILETIIKYGLSSFFTVSHVLFYFFIAILIITLVFFISEKASNVAKWIIIIWSVLGALLYIPITFVKLANRLFGFGDIIGTIQTAIILYSIYLLFTPESRAWFAAPRPQQTPESTQQNAP